MNSKKAKALRKQAKVLAEGYNFPKLVYTKKTYNPRREVLFDKAGGGYREVVIKRETLLLGECERKVYKVLKQQSINLNN